MTLLEGAFPSTVSPEVQALLKDYMHLSNAPSIHNEHEKDEQAFLDLFTSDAIYQFADHKHQGRDAIHAFREFLYGNISHRDHYIKKIYTDGSNDLELMALGAVKYEFEEEQKASQHNDWAAKYSIVKVDGSLKFKTVQIITNPAHEEESKKPE